MFNNKDNPLRSMYEGDHRFTKWGGFKAKIVYDMEPMPPDCSIGLDNEDDCQRAEELSEYLDKFHGGVMPAEGTYEREWVDFKFFDGDLPDPRWAYDGTGSWIDDVAF